MERRAEPEAHSFSLSLSPEAAQAEVERWNLSPLIPPVPSSLSILELGRDSFTFS